MRCACSRLCSLLWAVHLQLPRGACLPLLCLLGFLALVGAQAISRSGTRGDRTLGGTFTYRSADPILMVFPEELKSLLAFCYG